jgi:glycosyltransferase involved in cell wall biosynthesis
VKNALNNAHKILSISKNTERDIISYFNINSKKITIIHNGASEKRVAGKHKSIDGLAKPYLLFLGASDQRRRVVDLVDAFNNLKAEGNDIQLILAGENFVSGASGIPCSSTRKAVETSSYKDDILLLGYLDEATKQWLYKNAITFVYPTLYEGFGLPILESFLYGSPIVTYKNSSIPEVGRDMALYANDWWGIKERVEEILSWSKEERAEILDKNKAYAEDFTWEKTSSEIWDSLKS